MLCCSGGASEQGWSIFLEAKEERGRVMEAEVSRYYSSVTHIAIYMSRESSPTYPKAMKLIQFLWPIYPRWRKSFKKDPYLKSRLPMGEAAWWVPWPEPGLGYAWCDRLFAAGRISTGIS